MTDALQLRLIPTRSRSPISKELSYPVGAEIVSRVLGDVPQFELLTLTFSSWGSGTAAELRQTLAVSEVTLLRASYLGPPWRDKGAEDWDLYIYAVPREYKAEARRLLVEQGLGRVRSWLSMEHPAIWHYSSKHCTVRVRFDDATVVVEAE